MSTDPRPGAFEATASAIAGLAAASIALLFRSRTLVPPGFFDGLAAVALGFALAPSAHRYLAAPAATLSRTLGLAVGALVAGRGLVVPFDYGALPLAAWILGAGAMQAGTRAKRNGIVLHAVGLVLLLVGCVVAWLIAAMWPETTRMRLAVLGAALTAAVALLVRAWLMRRAPKLAPSPVGILLVAALGATYVAYRPLVAASVANLPLYEWTLGVAVAVLLLGRVRRAARDSAVGEAWTGDTRKHAQDAAPAYDPRMPPLAAAIQRYLDRGEGFGEYRAAMLRAAPYAPPSFRKALQGAEAVQGRGRAAKAARAERLRAHEALLNELIQHGDTAPAVRPHP